MTNNIENFLQYADRERFLDDITRESYGCSTVRIQGDDSGELSDWIPQGIDSSYDVTSAQREWLDGSYEDMLEMMKTDLGYNLDDYDKLTPGQQEHLHEYEHEWFEPALLQLSVDRRRGQVFIELSVNYCDAPYYRYQCAELIASFDVSQHGFDNMQDRHFKMILESLYKQYENHDKETAC